MCGKQDGLVFSLFLLTSLDHVAEAPQTLVQLVIIDEKSLAAIRLLGVNALISLLSRVAASGVCFF